ncbi:integrase [Desulfitispora alkaliphila]|uniref:hypothetical protein n=1 Tax=Desulfitispora alkaliphila TaxID=622674 RepID=UPI003D24D777
MSILKDATKNDLIERNIMDRVTAPKVKEKTPYVYSQNNFTDLLNVVSGTDDEVPILLAGLLGLRRGEVFGLKWENINFRHFNASMMLKYGIDVKVAAERLGHSTTQTTHKNYQHVLKDIDIEAANKLNNLLEK